MAPPTYDPKTHEPDIYQVLASVLGDAQATRMRYADYTRGVVPAGSPEQRERQSE